MVNYQGLQVPAYTDPADGPLSFQRLVESGPVPRFASATARNNAIPSPVEGKIAYRSDIKRIEVYNGNAWVAAGLPLVGGALSGPLNMTGNQITNLPSPTYSHNPVTLGFGDARYVRESDAIPWSKLSAIPNPGPDARTPLRVDDSFGNGSTTTALAANAGKRLNQIKLDVKDPIVDGTILADAVAVKLSGDDWSLSAALDPARMVIRRGTTSHYRITASSFTPGTGGGSKHLGESNFPWNNVYYAGSLVKPSSASLKTDITDHVFDALDVIRRITPKAFRWRSTGSPDIGFIAEDMPLPIRRDGEVPHIVQDQLVVHLWQAVRQLADRLDALTAGAQ